MPPALETNATLESKFPLIKKYIKKYGETSGRASVGKGLNIGGLIVSWFFTVFMAIYFGIIILLVIQGLNGGVPNVNPGVTF